MPKRKDLGSLRQVVVTKEDDVTINKLIKEVPGLSQSELLRYAIKYGLPKAVETIMALTKLKEMALEAALDPNADFFRPLGE